MSNQTGTTKVGINGFGRIGRQVLRTISERHTDTLEVVAVNDLGDPKTYAHLYKYDTNYGVYDGTVEASDGGIVIDGREIKFFSERDPASIPWSDVGAEIVVESTGVFTDAKKAAAHRDGGAKKVVISAPASNEDLTVVLGVNDDQYDAANHHVISNASCTTNCVAPMVKVLHDNFGVEKGLMTTIHAYTNDQNTQDGPHSDLRRARTAAMSIIPTTTGAARAVTIVIPELKGRLDGMAFRVPTSTVSVTDLVAILEKPASVDEINEAYRQASMNDPLHHRLGYSVEPLVSIDYKGNPNSCTIDALSTTSLGGNMVKVIGWYDNEWGYASRTADLCAMLAEKGL
jgi:glyceraldehyde 3-phosphate dehydrogenase